MTEEILTRQFEATLDESDGRTIIGRCAPFNEPARVADPPDFIEYEELFRPGAFRGATRAPNRVLLDFEHELGISGVLGHGVEFEERQDGLVGRFRVLEHSDGEKALALVREKILTGLSVMFRPLRQITTAGRVERTAVRLDRVSLCRSPAYDSALVFGVRQRLEVSAKPFDPALAERLEKLGVPVPETLRV